MIDRFNNENEFLSNFYPHPVYYEGITYRTVEHAYQAAKSFSVSVRKWIASAPRPGTAKMLGKKIKVIRPDWKKVKDNIMLKLLRKKFNNPHLRDLLLATGDEKLIEGNYWHDNYWGNCTCSKCKRIIGKNMLGKLLMKIRKELRDEIAHTERFTFGIC